MLPVAVMVKLSACVPPLRFSIGYTQTGTVNDSLTSANLTVNGTTGNDNIQLGNNRFIVNSATAINHIGNSDLIINGNSGSDTVNNLAAETVNTGSLTITNVDSVGSNSNPLATSINQIILNSINGDIYIDEID